MHRCDIVCGVHHMDMQMGWNSRLKCSRSASSCIHVTSLVLARLLAGLIFCFVLYAHLPHTTQSSPDARGLCQALKFPYMCKYHASQSLTHNQQDLCFSTCM